MSFGVIVFVVTTWILVSLIFGIAEGALLSGGVGGAQSTLNTLMHADFASTSFWDALGSMVTFNFPAVFYGSFTMLQWVFFLAIFVAFGIVTVGFILSHIPLIGRGG